MVNDPYSLGLWEPPWMEGAIRSNVSLIDSSTKYTWEFSSWGSSQRCCSGSWDLKLLAGSGYCWVLLAHSCRSESLLFLAFQAEPLNSPERVPKFKESRLLKQKVFADFETVVSGDKGREREPGEGRVGIQWLPRPEQKSSFFSSIQTLSNFLHCSCNQHASPAFT